MFAPQPFLYRSVPREIFIASQQESLLHKEDEDNDENDAKGNDEKI
jgi:hypothetical protein